MNYLERVIKETMRFLPPAPYLARDIEETTELSKLVNNSVKNMIIVF